MLNRHYFELDQLFDVSGDPDEQQNFMPVLVASESIELESTSGDIHNGDALAALAAEGKVEVSHPHQLTRAAGDPDVLHARFQNLQVRMLGMQG